jgi:hypothetical protein
LAHRFPHSQRGLIALVVGLALLAEVFEAWSGFRFAQRYGGSSRAGWGAVLGRAAAAAGKMAVGVVMVVGALFVALRA